MRSDILSKKEGWEAEERLMLAVLVNAVDVSRDMFLHKITLTRSCSEKRKIGSLRQTAIGFFLLRVSARP
jgi:hypothetical protein